MEFLGFLAYLLTKFAAYSGWCYVGLRWFDSSREDGLGAACSMDSCGC